MASTNIGYFSCNRLGIGQFRQLGGRADFDAALRVFLDIAEVVDLLDVDQIAGRLLQPVLQANQQVGAAGVNCGAGAVLREDLDRFVDGGRLVDGNFLHACLPDGCAFATARP